MWWKVTLQGDNPGTDEPLTSEAHRLSSAAPYRLSGLPVCTPPMPEKWAWATFIGVDATRLLPPTRRSPAEALRARFSGLRRAGTTFSTRGARARGGTGTVKSAAQRP